MSSKNLVHYTWPLFFLLAFSLVNCSTTSQKEPATETAQPEPIEIRQEFQPPEEAPPHTETQDAQAPEITNPEEVLHERFEQVPEPSQQEAHPDNKPPSPYWAVRAGYKHTDYSTGLVIDAQGDIVITGGFEKLTKFGNTTLTAKGSYDLFVAKLNPKGQWLWVVRAGGVDSGCSSDSVSTDSHGNIIIAGTFSNQVNFGNTTLSASKKELSAFVAKLDSSGQWLWAQKASGANGSIEGKAVQVDKSDNIFVIGHFSETVNFGKLSLTSVGQRNAFVAKLDKSGQWLWAKRAGSKNSSGEVIAADTKGNCVIGGWFIGAADFGTTKLKSKDDTQDLFIAKLDTAGQWLWVKQIKTTESEIRDMVIDKQDNIIVTGDFLSGLDVGKLGLSQGDLFVLKLDSNGNGLWISAASSNRTHEYKKSGVSTTTVDQQGNIAIAGTIRNQAFFGKTKLNSVGLYSIFVAKLDNKGEWLWATRPNKYSNAARGIIADVKGNIIVTGTFSVMGDFGGTILKSSGAYDRDIFVWKLPPQLQK